MADYTPGYQIKEITTGSEAGTWGDATNENWERMDDALGGSVVVNVESVTTPSAWAPTPRILDWCQLDTADSGTAGTSATPIGSGRARCVVFADGGDMSAGDVTVNIRGNSTSNLPERCFYVKNSLSDSASINFDLGGTDFTLKNGKTAILYTSATAKGPSTQIAANSVNNIFDNMQSSSVDVGNINVTSNTVSTTNTDGDLTFDLNGAGTVKMAAHTTPSANNTYDLGSSGLKWKDAFFQGTITGDVTGDVTGDLEGDVTGDVTGTATTATNVTVSDESSDETCFPLFATAVTGDLPPKSGTNLTFNSNTGILTATGFAGNLTGDVTGHADIVAGTKMYFYQDAEPTGWSFDSSLNDKLLMVTSTEADGGDTLSGGTWTISGLTIGNTALTAAQMPRHKHSIYMFDTNREGGGSDSTKASSQPSSLSESNAVAIETRPEGGSAAGDPTDATTGNGDNHTHTASFGSTWRPECSRVICCERD